MVDFVAVLHHNHSCSVLFVTSTLPSGEDRVSAGSPMLTGPLRLSRRRGRWSLSSSVKLQECRITAQQNYQRAPSSQLPPTGLAGIAGVGGSNLNAVSATASPHSERMRTDRTAGRHPCSKTYTTDLNAPYMVQQRPATKMGQNSWLHDAESGACGVPPRWLRQGWLSS